MIAELLVVLSFVLSGSCLVAFFGLKGWYVPFIGFLTGASLYVVLGLLLVIVGLNTSPAIALVLLSAFIFLLLIYDYRKDERVRLTPRSMGIVLLAIVAIVAFLWNVHLFNWHVDSFFNMETGAILANSQYDKASMTLIAKRLLAIPFIHGAGNLVDQNYYLRSFTPLLSLSLMATIAWVAFEGLKQKVQRSWLVMCIGLGLLLMLSVNRFVFHSFYINGHLFFATLLLVVAGFSWLIAMKNTWQKINTFLLVCICISVATLVITRPEGSIVAGLTILPLLLNKNVAWAKRIAPAATLAFSMIAWQGYVSYAEYNLSGSVSLESYGLLLAGIILLVILPLTKLKQLTSNQVGLVWAAEAVLWAALVVLTVWKPAVQIKSIFATYQNVVLGSWGWSLIILALIAGLLIMLAKTPKSYYLRFPFTTFVVLGFLLAYMRGGGYRVGNGDSFNRMLIQIVPLVILYIIVAVASDKPRFRLKKAKNLIGYKVILAT